jgi:hypothetical protein
MQVINALGGGNACDRKWISITVLSDLSVAFKLNEIRAIFEREKARGVPDFAWRSVHLVD